MALLLTLATGAWAQDPDPIDLTPSADGTVWTLSTMPEYDVELEVTYYTDAELDQMAADEVIAKITAIGTVTYTPESKALIDAARTAYDALTAAQQALVTNYSTLTDAETTYATAEETAYTEGVELTKNPDGTWSLAATPAFDVELEVEYEDTYDITGVAEDANGNKVEADVTSATEGTEITLTITTADTYTLKNISATGVTLSGTGATRTFTMPAAAVTVTATWEEKTQESATTQVTENVDIADGSNATVTSIEVGTQTTSITISGTVSDGTTAGPVSSIAAGPFTSEKTAKVQSIDLSQTSVNLDMARTADNSPVKDVPANTLIYLPAGSSMTGDNVIIKDGSNFNCVNFVMTDTKSYSVPHAFTATTATLNRVFTANQTCTVCLPYDVPAANIPGKIYTFTSVDNNQVTMTEDVDGLNANVPYIFVPNGTDNISATGSITVAITDANPTANDFTFKGIYEYHKFTATEISKGIYGFAGANAVGTTPGHFAKAVDGAYIEGMRAYLEYTGSTTDPGLDGPDVPVSSPHMDGLDTPLPNSMDVILVDADGTTTNIGKMELMDHDDSPRYNLNGQRVSKSHKGIVINNGKKGVLNK